MITTDTGAKKIEGTDNWRQIFGAHNDTVDAYDANIEALQDALGIVVDGNQSAVSASSGQFIILKNSSIVDSGDDLLPDGLYTAAKAIPANTVIDKTYLTADAAGGLNALNSKLTNTGYSTAGLSYSSGVSYSQGGYVFYGNLCVVQLVLSITSNKAMYDQIFAGLPKPIGLTGGGNPVNAGSSNTALENVTAGLRGFASSAISSGSTVRIFAVYIAKTD